MNTLPQFQNDDRVFQMMQNAWASILNPIIKNPATQSLILESISLATGTNVINHRLGRKLQGWKIVRQRSAASIFDEQDTNQMSALTLVLVSDADVIINLEVF